MSRMKSEVREALEKHKRYGFWLVFFFFNNSLLAKIKVLSSTFKIKKTSENTSFSRISVFDRKNQVKFTGLLNPLSEDMKKLKKFVLLLGILITVLGGNFMVGQGEIFAQTADECKYKDYPTNEKGRNQSGCVLKSGCKWDDTKSQCTLKSTVKEQEAKEKTSGFSCVVWGKNKSLFSDEGDDKCEEWCAEGVGGFAADDCSHREGQDSPVSCDTPEFLSNKGKRKCRKSENLETAAEEAKLKEEKRICEDSCDADFEKTLKKSEDREAKKQCKAKCEEDYQKALGEAGGEDGGIGGEELDIYTGPVFQGPGLRQGSKIARQRLDRSISKERDLRVLAIQWTKFLLSLGAILAVIALVWAGFQYVTAFGDDAKIESSKKIIIWVVVGMILIFGAYAIVNTIMKAQFGNTFSQREISAVVKSTSFGLENTNTQT